MSLRTKLFLSFLIPTVMWFAVGAWTSSRMRTLGDSVGGILADNERSIQYSVEMVQALERMDSGILLKINGDSAAYAGIMDSASVSYQKALALAAANITAPGEKELIDNLRDLSEQYLTRIREVAVAPNIANYNQRLYPTFVATRRAISDLRAINTEAMYATAGQVIDKAKRAALPGDLLMFAALFFGIAFVVLSHAFIIKPIRQLDDGVRLWEKSGKFEEIPIETHDELERIAKGMLDMYRGAQKEKT